MSDVQAGVPAAGLDEEERIAEAQERLKDQGVELAGTEQHTEPPAASSE